MPQIFWIIIGIAIFSTVVGAIAKFLNNMNEMNNAPRNRPPARPEGGAAARAGDGQGGGGVVRQSSSDMDRFLAEIDRLRKKNTEPANTSPGQSAPVAPVVQPAKQPDRPRPRVVAELAEPRATDMGFGPPVVPTATTGPKAGDLPLATAVAQQASTGAPATRVTRIAGRPRPIAKTPFARNLTSILNSGHGLALAIVLQEVLGPPRSKH